MYYQQSKYELGETVRTNSPPNEGKLAYSRSLEMYSSLLTGDSSKSGAAAKQSVDKQNSGRNNSYTTITFDESIGKVSFKFNKCDVPIENNNPVSTLSNNIVPIKFKQFKVYFPKKSNPFFVHVSQPDTATVESVMKRAIETYNETAAQKLPVSMEGYKFYMADDDGSPEEFGILGAGQVASKMGNDFTIVPARDPGVSRAASVDRRSLPGTVVIWLPEGSKATIPIQLDMRISDVIKKVCDKRNLNPADHHLTAAKATLSSNLKVQDLNPDDSLELCPNVVEGSESDEPEMTTIHDTFKYKAFEVMYKKKPYSLGIDVEYIQLKKKATFGFSKEKKELRAFKELVSIVEKGTKGFTITWKDGKQDIFESNQRKEIMRKIEGIQQRQGT